MTKLTDRLRTCAAHLLDHAGAAKTSSLGFAIHDAAKLLLEAADTLDASGVGTVVMDTQTTEYLGIPIAPIPVKEQEFNPQNVPPELKAHWYGDDLKPIPNQPLSRNACPKCDSRATKTVRKAANRLMLECPVCGHQWRR